MNLGIRGLIARKDMRFVMLAVFVVILAVFAVGYSYINYRYRTWMSDYRELRSKAKADEPKYRAEMERVMDRVIPNDFILTESKFSPMNGIDTTHELRRTYTVNKPREVVIDELLRSLRALGYSPEETDIPREKTVYYTSSSTYDECPCFSIDIPYEEPPIRIEVHVVP
jgi:hypothetical protein